MESRLNRIAEAKALLPLPVTGGRNALERRELVEGGEAAVSDPADYPLGRAGRPRLRRVAEIGAKLRDMSDRAVRFIRLIRRIVVNIAPPPTLPNDWPLLAQSRRGLNKPVTSNALTAYFFVPTKIKSGLYRGKTRDYTAQDGTELDTNRPAPFSWGLNTVDRMNFGEPKREQEISRGPRAATTKNYAITGLFDRPPRRQRLRLSAQAIEAAEKISGGREAKVAVK